ncbi:MAG: hypothetical protein N2109_03750 [Fimbriimonadales bacterium]|nr:hypothetical protein [Fimbriimonadales bacterium]
MLWAVSTVVFAQPRLEWVEPPRRTYVPAVARLQGVPAPDGSHQLHPTLRVAVLPPRGRTWSLVPYLHQPFERSLGANGKEVLQPSGSPEWRVRFTPLVPGTHALRLEGSGAELRSSPVVRGTPAGFLQPNARNPRWLVDRGGKPFFAVGWNLCWHGSRGTYDYDDWLPKLAANGVNFVRLWSCPWAFNVEATPGTLGRYDQRGLWALERVLEQCRQLGIHAMLCIDYHGVLNIEKDYWGSNDFWTQNPYNASLGGPCREPKDFFASAEAKRLSRERLRYLVARFAAFPNLAVWEFWNEIDNNLRWLDAGEVVRWHGEMGEFLRREDPYGRLISTSTSWSPWPDLWSVPAIGLQQVHSYGQSSPAAAFTRMARDRFELHRKPFWIGEYGVDFRGPSEEKDPHRRGLRQAVWSTALSGAAGTAMPWWWETLHARNAHGLWKALAAFLEGTGLAGPEWNPLRLKYGQDPAELGPPNRSERPGALRFHPADQWSVDRTETVALSGPASLSKASRAFSRFLHGTSKEEVRRPIRLKAHLGSGAKLRIHVDSVSNGAALQVKANGNLLRRIDLPNRDGAWLVNKEYDETFEFPLPEGENVLIEIENPGEDWVNLEWIEVAQVLPADSGANGPAVFATGVGARDRGLLWILDQRADWPSLAADPVPPVCRGARVGVLGLPSGRYRLRWFDPSRGRFGEQTEAESRGGRLRVDVPAFRGDVAVRIEPMASGRKASRTPRTKG